MHSLFLALISTIVIKLRCGDVEKYRFILQFFKQIVTILNRIVVYICVYGFRKNNGQYGFIVLHRIARIIKLTRKLILNFCFF